MKQKEGFERFNIDKYLSPHHNEKEGFERFNIDKYLAPSHNEKEGYERFNIDKYMIPIHSEKEGFERYNPEKYEKTYLEKPNDNNDNNIENTLIQILDTETLTTSVHEAPSFFVEDIFSEKFPEDKQFFNTITMPNINLKGESKPGRKKRTRKNETAYLGMDM